MSDSPEFDALELAVATARGAHNAALFQIGERDATIEAKNQLIGSLTGELSAATAEIDRLQARVDELEGTPPPPPKRIMYVGSSVQAKNTTQAAAIATLEKALGKRLGVRREFDGDGVDPAWIAAAAALDQGRAQIYSHKGKVSQLTKASYDALPADGFPTWWVLQHEAERAEKNNSPAAMRAEFNTWIEKIRAFNQASGRTDVFPAVCYTGYLDRDNSATTTTRDWMPTVDLTGVVFLIDPYDPNGKKTLRQQYSPALAAARAHGFTRWGIAETGTHRDDAARAAWIRQGIPDAFADGCEVLCWFHSDVGGNAGTGWYLDGKETLAAFASFLPAVTA